MALSSPSLTLAVPAMFGMIKPTLDGIRKLGVTDFSADAPGVQIKPGATIKVPVSSVSAASQYDASSNNYLTGGATTWASLTAYHYLQGFDITGVNVDQGADAGKMKQLFAVRAGAGIAAAIQAALKSALDGATTSTGITLTAIAAASGSTAATAPSIDEYLALAESVSWLDKATSVLAVNGTLLASMKKTFAAANIVGTPDELAQYCGFKGCCLVPGMTARAAIVPASSVGFLGRVPTVLATYPEYGTEVDEDSGLAIGIVRAEDQATNKQVVNADLWFGATVQSANAAASTAGVIKIS